MASWTCRFCDFTLELSNPTKAESRATYVAHQCPKRKRGWVTMTRNDES